MAGSKAGTEPPSPPRPAAPVSRGVAAYAELVSGEFGTATLDLLVGSVLRVARRYGFPPPDGLPSWTTDLAHEWLHDELIPRKGAEIVLRMSVEATDGASLARLVERVIHRVFQDVAKATPVGKMIRRLRTLIPKLNGVVDARATLADEGWALEGAVHSHFWGDWEDLLRAPGLRQIAPIPVLNTSGPTPPAVLASLTSAVDRMLEHAKGAVKAADLAHALVELYELSDPVFWPLLDDYDSGFDGDLSDWATPDPSHDVAQAIMDELDEVDLLAIPFMASGESVVETALLSSGISVSFKEISERLSDLNSRFDPPPGTWGRVIVACEERTAIMNNLEEVKPE